MVRPRVVVVKGPSSESRHWSDRAAAEIAAFADRIDITIDPAWPSSQREQAVDNAIAEADALLLCGWGGLGVGYLSAERLARASRLRFLGATCHYRHAEFVDVDAADARGIAMCETAPVMSPWVAEYELALGLNCLRRIPQEHQLVGAGGWVETFVGDPDWPDRLEGRQVGLVSFGQIHRHLARYLAPFDVEWQAFDPFVSVEQIETAGGRRADDLVELARFSEMLFVATPPNPTTIGLIDRAVFEALRPGAVFVLVSRMAVVDQASLLERLRRGDLRAAIDVYDPEPPPPDSLWRHLEGLIHTPHRAGHTAGAHRGVFMAQCEEARRHFGGEPLRYPLRRELVNLFRKPAL